MISFPEAGLGDSPVDFRGLLKYSADIRVDKLGDLPSRKSVKP